MPPVRIVKPKSRNAVCPASNLQNLPRSAMQCNSSEFLLLDEKYQKLIKEQLEAEQERRRKLIELGQDRKKQQQQKQNDRQLANGRTCKQRLAHYVTWSLSMITITGCCALLFLLPLYVDPAISTLMADFFPEPVLCTTTRRDDIWGLFNCTWSSCREGCTSEVYRCTHIYVTYDPWINETRSENNNVEVETTTKNAVLLVNIKGCGYPPEVDCENFTREHGYEGSQFPCYYSRVNRSVVLPDYNRDAEITIIVHYFVVPFLVTLSTTIVLCVWHCDCRSSSNQRSLPASRKKRTRKNVQTSATSIAVEPVNKRRKKNAMKGRSTPTITRFNDIRYY